MSDSSAAIPWATAALGCIVSCGIAHFSMRPTSALQVLGAGLKAIGIGVAFFFVGSLLHGLCIDAIHMCKSHGDVNIKYAMGGLLATPAYWIILALCSRTDSEGDRPPKNQFIAASAEAFQQRRNGHKVTAKCPKCLEFIKVLDHVANEQNKYLIASCKCTKCNTNVRLRRSEASYLPIASSTTGQNAGVEQAGRDDAGES